MAVREVALSVTLVALLFVGVYATSSDTFGSQTTDATSSFRSYVGRQYDAFMDPNKAASLPATGQARLTTARSSRSEAYRVAIAGFKAHPLSGDGAGGYAVRWIHDRKLAAYFRNAHSLELETASDLGLIGVLLLAGILGPLCLGLRRLQRGGGALSRAQASAAGGVVVVWLTHSITDWDWQMAAATLPALLCGALLLTPSRSRRRTPARRRRRRRRVAA